MGSIDARPRKNGDLAYLARVTIKQGGKIVHREGRTFELRREAVAWIKRRETELAVPGALEREESAPTLAQAIDRYIAESRKAIGKTKAQVLSSIKAHAIADKACGKIGSADLIAFAAELSKGRQPSTVANYMSHLSAVFAVARPAWGYALDHRAVKEALAVTRRLGTTGKSRERNRRTTLDELDLLMTHFDGVSKRRPSSLPMCKIILFAIFSTRRQEEITRIAWSNLDKGRVLVPDMKHPGQKIGNDTWCDLVPEAMAIIETMPKTAVEIFPYSTDAISAAFTRACAFLGIEDLHFHDLRHEGVSRLFEMGWGIPHVAAVSGHRSWQSLRRYTHLRQSGDKFENWPWLATVSLPSSQPADTPPRVRDSASTARPAPQQSRQPPASRPRRSTS